MSAPPDRLPDPNLPRGTTVFPSLVQVHFDGACEPARGGGVATYGFAIEGDGYDYEEGGLAVRPYSRHATNNVAEYTAAIRALEHLRAEGFRGQVLLIGDSQLVIRQMNGEYEVRAPHLKEYHRRLADLAASFEDVRFVWVPREENRRADELSKTALEEAAPVAQKLKPSIPEVPEPEPEDGPSLEPGPGSPDA